MTYQVVEVTGGIDTHKDTHTAAAVDSAGRVLGSARFPATNTGYGLLPAWLRSLGTLVLVGVEGTGAYGAGPARFLRAAGVAMVEIDRPDRKTRRWQGKSDPSTPKPPCGRHWPDAVPAPPSTATARSRRCARCGRPDAARSANAPTSSAASRH